MNAPFKPASAAETSFVRRHIGPSPRDVAAMLDTVGPQSPAQLLTEPRPGAVRQKAPLDLGRPLSETEALMHMRTLAAPGRPFIALIGQGYAGTLRPAVIQRNSLGKPAWYTA